MSVTTYLVGAGLDGVAESRANPMENPSIPLGDAEAMRETFGWGDGTDSGVPVTPQGALAYSPVWSCVDQISSDAARLPLSLWRRTDGEDREPAKNHASYRLVRRRPNHRTAAYHFWRQIIADACLYPGGYAWISGATSPSGSPRELLPLLPDRTYYSDRRGVYLSEIDGQLEAFLPEEILHVRGLSTSLGVCDPVDSFRNSIALGLAAEKFASRFFKHGTKAGGILELPLGISKKAADNVEEGFRRSNEGRDNWFKTVILRDGAKFHQTMIAARDAQTSELREDQVRDVARFYKMPPSRLGLSDSVSYNSKTEDNQSYLDTCLSGWLETIVAECWMKLLTRPEQDADELYFEHNTAALLRMNAKERAEVYHYGIQDGWMSRLEVRRKENLGPADGLEKFLWPANLNVEGAQPDQGVAGGERSHAMRRVIYHLGSAARKRAEKPESLRQWVAGGLAYHRQQYRDLVADDQEEAVLGPIIRQLRAALDTDDPAATVDGIMTHLERSV